MIIEAGFIGLLLMAYRKAGKRGVMTPERETMFYEALENIKGKDAPRLFRKLADGFAKYGFPMQAKILRTRADYLDVTPEKREERKSVIRKAMQSTNVEAIEHIASIFEKQTASGIARDLRKHAQDVREGKFVRVTPPSTEQIKEEVVT